ncbi:hypothetical protein TeGR_g5640 [Tetraparma gracilis]|uniref:Glycoside hydrolase family 65 central catalytic domain-containing protein n=1 Tax=Tetraparma gracilis TaxID=2962635 RepID=A0ABQ6MMY9_9STRA|nr:hypothetical protein TeGR_g5640 [Tetraparma gracilis]
MYSASSSAAEYPTSLGNGYVATTVGSDTMYAAGIFNGASTGDDPSHRAALPSPLAVTVASSPLSGSLLHMREAAFYDFYDDGTTVCTFAHRSMRSLLVVSVTSEASPPAPVSLSSSFSTADTPDVAFSAPAASTIAGRNVTVLSGSTLTPEDPSLPAGTTRSVCIVAEAAPAEALPPFTLLSAVRTDLDSEDPCGAAASDFALAAAEKDLFASHTASHGDLLAGGIETSRPDVAAAANSSFYSLLSSLRADHPFSLSPGGLSNNAYNGHTFWDCETWMFPPLAFADADLARSLLEYRVSRMDAAALKARSYENETYGGSMFPWESAASGVETCPSWAATGALEQHVTADVMLAARQYYYLTGDDAWLKSGGGLDLLAATADFYVSRVSTDADGLSHITCIIPPDEYAECVDDSPYTNFAAKAGLEFAVEAHTLANVEPKKEWGQVADSLVVLEAQDDTGATYHPEYAGYEIGTEIKQADVVLLGYPLGLEMDAAVRRNDLDIYAAVTDGNGPAMTWAMHAVGFLELLEESDSADDAGALFNRSFANVKEPFLTWTETPEGGAVGFITGAGGFLQGLYSGWGGLRVEEAGVLTVRRPKVVEGWEGGEGGVLKMRGVPFMGRRVDIEVVGDDEIRFLVTAGEEGLVLVIDEDGDGEPEDEVALEVGREVVRSRVFDSEYKVTLGGK